MQFDETYYLQKVNTIMPYNGIQYKLLEKIQYGVQGCVYKAENKQTNEIIALKLQHDISENESKVLNYFIQNQSLMKYNVRMYGAFQSQSQKCVLMEYANGGNLYDYLNNNPYLSMDDKLDMMKQLALGVQELHKLKLIHRDIKPENVVIFNDKDKITFKICDIGLVKMLDPTFKDLMKTGTGTFSFMAPEMMSSMDYDQKVDIWALGVLYYEILFLKPLYGGNDDKEIQQQQRKFQENRANFEHEINQLGLSIDQKRILNGMMLVNPSERVDIDVVVSLLTKQTLQIKINPQIPNKNPVQPQIPEVGKDNEEKQNIIKIIPKQPKNVDDSNDPPKLVDQNAPQNLIQILASLKESLLLLDKEIKQLHNKQKDADNQIKILTDNSLNQMSLQQKVNQQPEIQDLQERVNHVQKQIIQYEEHNKLDQIKILKLLSDTNLNQSLQTDVSRLHSDLSQLKMQIDYLNNYVQEAINTLQQQFRESQDFYTSQQTEEDRVFQQLRLFQYDRLEQKYLELELRVNGLDNDQSKNKYKIAGQSQQENSIIQSEGDSILNIQMAKQQKTSSQNYILMLIIINALLLLYIFMKPTLIKTKDVPQQAVLFEQPSSCKMKENDLSNQIQYNPNQRIGQTMMDRQKSQNELELQASPESVNYKGLDKSMISLNQTTEAQNSDYQLEFQESQTDVNGPKQKKSTMDQSNKENIILSGQFSSSQKQKSDQDINIQKKKKQSRKITRNQNPSDRWEHTQDHSSFSN